MQLSEYLQSNDISVSEFARLIGAKSRATIHRYMKPGKGKRIPDETMMPRIHEVTNGQVTANDFYDLPKKINRKNKKAKQ